MLETSVMMTANDYKCILNLKVVFVKASTRPPILGLSFVSVDC